MTYTCSKCPKDGLLFLLEGKLCPSCHTPSPMLKPPVNKPKFKRAKVCQWVECGAKLNPSLHGLVRFCSPECKRLKGVASSASFRLKQRATKCPECRERFKKRTKEQKFCSQSCYHINRHKAYLAKRAKR
jgi:hypothetical protein